MAGEHNCRVCKAASILLGKKLFMPLLGHHYPEITLSDVAPHTSDLDLEIVGGLKKRGWTVNDIDVIGEKSDVQVLAERLRKRGIKNPLHYCGKRTTHSHFQSVYYGIKLVVAHKGY